MVIIMKNSYLPIGSIITAEGQDLMICAYINKKTEINGNYYDYACCLYPSGLGPEAILIKKEQIKDIKFIGFQNGKYYDYLKQLENKNE